MTGVFELSKRFIAQKEIYLGYDGSNHQLHFKAHQAFTRRTMAYSDLKQWFNVLSVTAVYQPKQRMRTAIQVTTG